MIRYVANNYIDRTKYDHCIRLDQLGLVYAYSWYLDEVCEHWDALVLNDYDAVWPLPSRIKMGFKYFYRPFGVQQLGIFTKSPLDPDMVGEFIELFRRQARYADVYLNEEQWSLLPKKIPLEIVLNTNLTLDLNRSFREIYHGYSKHTQRNVVRSGKNDLQVFEHDSPDSLVALFKENRGEQLSLDPQFYRNINTAMYNCLHRGLGKVWTAYDERNSLCAGIFIVETDKRHTLLFSASGPEGRKLRAMYYLINEYLIHASGQPKVFDFEGSNDVNLKRFYEGFGATESQYPRLKFNRLPMPLKWFKS